LGVAAANATLDIFEKENIISKNKEKIEYINESLEKFKKLSNVKEVRQTGMIAAVEMIDYPWEERKGLKVYEYGLRKGVLLRPLGNVIYFMPPYIINKEEIDLMTETAFEAIKKLEDR
jgi:adenosylmethionine-8-amino-7-oxononanoate aminotransferase